MPKRPRSCGLSVDHCPPERRHLYLVLDDWLWGYSIRKLDLHQAIAGHISGEGAMDAGIDHTEQEQPPPPILFRLQAPRGLPRYFATIDTKILAMHPNGRDLPFFCNSLFPVFDIGELGLIFGPRPKADWVDPIYIPVGDRLFALACDSFQLLSPPPLGEASSGQFREWSWCRLQKPPFDTKYITSYAVHPDGRTVFVSVQMPTFAGTFAYGMAEGMRKWRAHSVMLPFDGCAHYDNYLDAWVGLSGTPGTFGHLCSFGVVPTCSDASSEVKRPVMKLSKEKLFSEQCHMGATLVYMGGRSNFCLVQCLVRQESALSEHRKYEFRLTSFCLKYDKNGDLTTGTSCHALKFAMPEGVSEPIMKCPVVFWM